MITTQPVKEDELRVPSHAQFELNGLDSLEQKKQFASNILHDEEDVKRFRYCYWCCVFSGREKLKHQLPNSRAGIYVGFIQTLLDHMVTKDLENVATDKSIDEYQENFAK